MTVSRQEVGEYLQRLRDAGDLEFASFMERHPLLLPDAAARDLRRRAAGDSPLPSVGEVLARARLWSGAPLPVSSSSSRSPPRPGGLAPATDAEFHAAAVEFVEECSSGFRREALVAWRLANGVPLDD